ncbi:MAG: ROK family transcriptional regulator [Anaerolineae bacterium]
MNTALILECLHQHAPLSRARLADMTGLNKATVSSLVRELLEAQYIRENGLNTGDTGRPSIQLELNPAAGAIIGAEIGVDFISILLTDFSAGVLWRLYERTSHLDGQDAILERVARGLEQAREAAQQAGLPVLGVGLGVPGLVDVATGTLLFAPNLGWTDVPLRQALEARFDFPIYVDNEANLAALGEAYFGAAENVRYVLYIHSSVGLGAGVVLDRRILSGTAGFAGEVGHMTVEPEGALCACGNHGCWETVASQRALFERIRAAINAGCESWLIEATEGRLDQITIQLVIAAARRGDAVALDALGETGHYLGIGLAGLINLLNPECIVFGGMLSLAHEYLLPPMKAEIERRALRWSREGADIVIAKYGPDACAIGGVATVYHRVLSRPLAAREPRNGKSRHADAFRF